MPSEFSVPSLSPRTMWFVGLAVGTFAFIGFVAVAI
jgi:hypothetical protein